MFPELSDVCNWGTKGEEPSPKLWTEETAGNAAWDRRFMQSAGPFTLRPGACNYITVGIPWARAAGTPWESVELLKIVDDKCQQLFDNCFAVLNGPNAPDLVIQELDKKLVIYITNKKSNDAGNNFEEKYVEYDPNIPEPESLKHNQRNDSLYRFEGYQIFQLKDASVSAADLDDPLKARLVGQCDIQNGVTKLVNWTFNSDLGGNSGVVEVTGEDRGIRHTFTLTEDLFPLTNTTTLVNHKQYYYTAVAYAYNQYKAYQPDSIDKGQLTPYLRGRGNIKFYTAIPHIPIGDKLNSDIGDGPVITRREGQGNGGMILELSDATVAEILAKPLDTSIHYGDPDYTMAYYPVYQPGAGPINVKVIDPLNVVSGSYKVVFDTMASSSKSPFLKPTIKFGKWTLIDQTGKTYRSDTTTIFQYEQLFLDLGLSITIKQVPFPGDTTSAGNSTHYTGNGLLSAPAAIYADSTQIWLGGVPDVDVPESQQNWIRSGIYLGPPSTPLTAQNYDFDMGRGFPEDPDKSYAKIQGGTWAPYSLAVTSKDQLPLEGVSYNLSSCRYSTMDNLASVDIVITPDSTKWTRCAVIEMCPDLKLSENGAQKFELRKHRSVNIHGDTGVVNSDPRLNSDYISKNGMGWFPGYAINLETGERLNIMFGENSYLVADNGRDMKWNPTSRMYDAVGRAVFGGMHYVYIMGTFSTASDLNFPAYDGCNYFIHNFTRLPEAKYKAASYGSAMYVGMPLSIDGKKWLDNEVKIKIRVSKPYMRYFGKPLSAAYSDTAANNCWPEYLFNTSFIATSKQNSDKQSSDLDLINVVPNPYYGYDDYEVRNQLDNRVKIVNLPLHCTVTIFNLNGTMIRQYIVDKTGITEPRGSTAGINTDSKTSIDWDLKNFAGLPVSGGVYLIHVKADGIGERTVKWFGILRPVDLNSF